MIPAGVVGVLFAEQIEAFFASLTFVGAMLMLTAQLLTFTQPADAALSAFFRARKSGARDRAFIAETAYAVLRQRLLLQHLAAAGKPEVDKSPAVEGAGGKCCSTIWLAVRVENALPPLDR